MTSTDGTASGAPKPLHIDTAGGPSSPAVVLLHSSGLSGRQWKRLATRLVAGGYRTLSIDLTGHGASEAWPEPVPFTFHRDVDHIVALLEREAQAQGPVRVVGHSYGAFIALLAAQRVPKTVRSLALFEPVAFGTLDAERDADARAELATVDFVWGETPDAKDRWLTMFVDYWGGKGAWAALREEARGEFRRIGWAVHEGVTSLVPDTTKASAYAVIECPVHLFSGELSPLAARRVALRLRDALPNATLATIPNAGHMGPLSHADAVNALLVAALGPATAFAAR